MTRALVLNASFEPLCTVPARRAFLLVLDEKAELVSGTGRLLHSPSRSFPEPSVVRLAAYVKVPYRARVALSRRAVFARDGHRCQYCGAAAENIDHVVPRSRGGQHVWENVVAACRRCNSHKEDRLLHETSLRLASKPVAPRERTWLILAMGPVRPEWQPFLPGLPATASLSA